MRNTQPDRRPETIDSYLAAVKFGEPINLFEGWRPYDGTLFNGRIYSTGPVNQAPFSFYAIADLIEFRGEE